MRAYILAREALALPDVWADIESLDNKIPAGMQTRVLVAVQGALEKAMEKLRDDNAALAHLEPSIGAYRKGLSELSLQLDVDEAPREFFEGVPRDVAHKVAILPSLVRAFDLVALAGRGKAPLMDLAEIFFGLNKRLDLAWLASLESQKGQMPWHREAIISACRELAGLHGRLTAHLAAHKGPGKNAVETWARANAERLKSYDMLLAESRAANRVDLAALLLANEKLRALQDLV
jgi:glutamate dehydrogenase